MDKSEEQDVDPSGSTPKKVETVPDKADDADLSKDVDSNESEEEEEAKSTEFDSSSEYDSSSGNDSEASPRGEGVDSEDDDEPYQQMPLVKYSRIVGSLPREAPSTTNGNSMNTESGRPLSAQCTCSTLGRVKIDTNLGLSDVLSTGNISGSINGTSILSGLSQFDRERVKFQPKQYDILAMGLSDGTIHLMDAKTGLSICPPKELKVHNQSRPYRGSGGHPNIVALSFDSGSHHLAALTSDGDVAIFELNYGLRSHERSAGQDGDRSHRNNKGSSGSSTKQPTHQKRPEQKLFDSFLSKLAGDESQKMKAASPADGGDQSGNRKDETEQSTVSIHVVYPISTARFSYKQSNNNDPTTKATCMVIDPSYNRRKDNKCILVGFSNGRLVYTKRSGHGGSVLDTGSIGGVMGSLLQPKRHDVDMHQSSSNNGIEAVAWRGSLIVWADASGIKVFDAERGSRIAHVDRPKGARASLYPHVSSLSPSLVFERSGSILVSWGDCLMCMAVSRPATSSKEEERKKKRRATVKCVMAWELDCVACDVQPIDEDYVAVLGLTAASSQADNIGGEDGTITSNFVELQVIKRVDGSVTSNDVLPLATKISSNERPSTAEFTFTSSFTISRMEDHFEAEGEESNEDGALTEVDLQSIIMNTMVSPINGDLPKKSFTNPHLKWSVDSYRRMVLGEESDDVSETESIESICSEDSDDYTLSNKRLTCPAKILANLPTMVITSPDDAVLAQIRDIDDAIEYARAAFDHSLALKHGLNHRQMLRRHDLNDLIDEYLRAILNPSNDVDVKENPRTLSIRRLKTAAKSTPILIGGDIRLWDRWVREFAKIPGGLFLLYPYLPVRDPKLPPEICESFLCDMFTELLEMISKDPGDEGKNSTSAEIHKNAVDLFLQALKMWGTTSSLRDKLKLHRITIVSQARDEPLDGRDQRRFYAEAESAFGRRMSQSAAQYLQYERDDPRGSQSEMVNSNSSSLPTGVTFDSLFSLNKMKTFFQEKTLGITNDRVWGAVFEVLTELHFMEGDSYNALKLYLKLGAQNIIEPLADIEDYAVRSVLGKGLSYVDAVSHDRYRHVLTMIETRDLHGVLLETNPNGNDCVPPLVALICLVGLQHAGHFIIKHSDLPRSRSSSISFPIEAVSDQLSRYPKLLLWYLHRILCDRPEIYVKFPNTAVPPSAVTDLHRTHFNLYIDFIDREDCEIRRLSEIPSFDELKREGPLLLFLKAALLHGGIRSEDVRKTLELCRAGEDKLSLTRSREVGGEQNKFPHLFAHELAYVIERSGSGTEEDSNIVLSLYLEGVVSLPHAVEYAERNLPHSSLLWESLVSYCLRYQEINEMDKDEENNGKTFGSLLEVAARSGADLANLVSKIPTNLRIDGIRHRLVAAISDYQMKLKIHEAASQILSHDKVSLLREQCHRSRRGTHVDLFSLGQDLIPRERASIGTNEDNIVFKEWNDGRTRLALKRKLRRLQRTGKDECIGMKRPSSLEIH